MTIIYSQTFSSLFSSMQEYAAQNNMNKANSGDMSAGAAASVTFVVTQWLLDCLLPLVCGMASGAFMRKFRGEADRRKH